MTSLIMTLGPRSAVSRVPPKTKKPLPKWTCACQASSAAVTAVACARLVLLVTITLELLTAVASAWLVLLVTIFLELLTAVPSARLVSLVTHILTKFLTVASAQMLISGLALQDYLGCSRGLEL